MAKKQINITVPAIIDTEEFHPTSVMQKVLLAHLNDISDPKRENTINPPKFLTAMGHCRSNYYKWQKMPGFKEWWSKAIEEYHSQIGLSNVHNALYKYALGNSPQDRKTYMERFDQKYKPATKTEIEAYPGQRPADAVQASKQKIEQFAKKKIVSEVYIFSKNETNLPLN